MRKVYLPAGIIVGIVASLLGAAPGSPSEPESATTLDVVARPGECVQFGYLSYVRGMAKGSSDPAAAVLELAVLDVSPGIGSALSSVGAMTQRTGADGELILEQREEDNVAGAYRLADLGEEGWVVTEFEYSGPCST